MKYHSLFSIILLCLFPLACSKGKPSPPSKDAPVAHFTFDGSLDDSSFMKHSAEAKGDGISFKAGVKGQGVDIDGSEDWIEGKTSHEIDFSRGATIEMWVQRAEWLNPYKKGAGSQTLFALGNIILKIDNRGSAVKGIWKLGGSLGSSKQRITLLDKAVLPAGTWHHLAMVYDPGDKKATLYLNGKAVAEKSGQPNLPGKAGIWFKMGTWHKQNNAFKGMMDEVKLYNYPRSSAQIVAAAKK